MSRLDPDDLSLYGFTKDSVIPKGTIKLAVTLGEPPLNDDCDDRLPSRKVSVSLQRDTRQTITKGLEGSDINSLPDNEVLYNSRNMPSSRMTVRL